MDTEHWVPISLAAAGVAAAMTKRLDALLDAIAHRIRRRTETTSYVRETEAGSKAALTLGWAEAGTDTGKREQIITFLSLYGQAPGTEATPLHCALDKNGKTPPSPETP
ncbi:hypothetical protein ACH47X_07985 [Promicromonospora kroppenstedtii]|uniref:Uncharacterized protein n=1 Tax=Promicromonospora kroppenstedtii TaxID=440482 RepID=A0ABW7XH47_9MICO